MWRNSLCLLCPAPAEYPRSKNSELEAGSSSQFFTFVAMHYADCIPHSMYPARTGGPEPIRLTCCGTNSPVRLAAAAASRQRQVQAGDSLRRRVDAIAARPPLMVPVQPSVDVSLCDAPISGETSRSTATWHITCILRTDVLQRATPTERSGAQSHRSTGLRLQDSGIARMAFVGVHAYPCNPEGGWRPSE